MAELSTPRRGDWMQLASGRQFWPLDPRPEEIFIEDIAHALAHQCRYAGHSRHFYSTAEHCVLLAQAAPPRHRLRMLLHDAGEAYVVDVPRPLKPFLDGYKAIEDGVQAAVHVRFDITGPEPDCIKRLDTAILRNEYEQVMAPCPADAWGLRYAGIPGVRINFWTPLMAEAMFLRCFHTYYGRSL